MANMVHVVLDTSPQTKLSGTWAQLATLTTHERAIAVFVEKDGGFFDEYSGQDLVSAECDAGGHLVTYQYDSGQGGKLKCRQTTTGGTTGSFRDLAAATEPGGGGCSGVRWDLKPNPTNAELDDARVLVGAS